MVNTNNMLIERNKELLAKIEELENKEKTEISREAQLKIINKIQAWKEENYEVGDRLKKYEGATYPSHITDNVTEDRPLFKALAGHVSFELMNVQYLHKKENPLDELLEIMFDSITKNVILRYSSEGLREKERKEREQKEAKLEGKITRLIKETFPYDKLKEKPLKWNERLGVERGYLDTINGIDHSDFIISFYKDREEELKEKELLIEESIKRAERGEEDAAIHFEALTKTSKKWNENKLSHWVQVFLRAKNWTIEYKKNLYNAKTKVLEKQVSDKANEVREKTVLLDSANETIEQKDLIISQLMKELKEKSELLDEANNKVDNAEKELKSVKKVLENEKSKIKDLTRKLSFAIKELPKKPNKLKTLKARINDKSQQLMEKTKQLKQELIAKIEIKTK